jgi:FkbM family methyltransferase
MPPIINKSTVNKNGPHMTNDIKRFVLNPSILEKLWFIYSQRLHRWMVRKSVNAYMRPADIISHRPTLFGYHEPHIEKLIRERAAEYPDFFIDIGANIGLVSCLVGAMFKRIIAVEPNPLMANILRTNMALALPQDRFEIHEIGLGHFGGKAELSVPRSNFGGAFLEDQNPQFTATGAANLTTSFDKQQDHFKIDINVKNARTWLKTAFKSLSNKTLTHGVIKIDVEGYEEMIFSEIINNLPKSMTAVVIMENWFKTFPVSTFTSTTHRFDWRYFTKRKQVLRSIPFKLLGLSSLYAHELSPLTDTSANPHDIICTISPKR